MNHLQGLLPVLVFLLLVGTKGSEDGKIRIESPPQMFRRPINGNVTLPCAVVNLDKSVVTWAKDGQVISADSFKVLQDARIEVLHRVGRGVDLYITGLHMKDTGQYKCTVNVNKQDIYIIHKLLVEVPPYIESLHPTNSSITVRKGSNVRLECKAGGQPKPSIYWSRQHNQPLVWKDGLSSINGEVLQLKNISREMGGSYMCNADNGVSSSPVHQTININVMYAPELYTERTWVHAGKHDDVTLACTVYGNPQPRVAWYKDTMKLLDGERVQMNIVGNSHRLSLLDVDEWDYGDYYCKAGNVLEEDVSIKFILTGKPSEPELIGDREGEDRYSFDLQWRLVSSYPILSHTITYWIQNNMDIESVPPKNSTTRRVTTKDSKDGFLYSIKGLQNNTIYDVIVKSQNKYGWGPFSSVFTFKTASKDKLPLEVKTPTETQKNIYQEIDPEPVTSKTVSRAHSQDLAIFLTFYQVARGIHPPV